MQIVKRIIYIGYNILYQLFSFFLFLYANTYVNEGFVPESLMWKGNKPRMDIAGTAGMALIKTIALLIEAAALILIIYYINRLFLNISKVNSDGKRILRLTLKIEIFSSLIVVAILIWGSFRGYLW